VVAEFHSPDRVLIVGAHPDDPDAFCGGSVARWAEEGASIWYVVVTSGDKGASDVDVDLQEFVRAREEEQVASAQFLGAEGVTFLRLIDGEVFDTLELRERITREIRRFRPDLIITHDPLTRMYRQHPDHRAVGFATLNSAFPSCRLATFFPEHRGEGLEPHVVNQILLFGSERPDTFMDIEPVFERKIQAVEMHISQRDAFTGGVRFRIRQRAEEAGRLSEEISLAESFLFVDLA
jgi:LmbE family N-acetylglucosaminyl deacetylase